MKKVQKVILLVLLLCSTIPCEAITYAPFGSMSEAPTVQMRSTSVWVKSAQGSNARMATAGNTNTYRGIYTAASTITGGRTSYDTYTPVNNGPRRAPGVPDIDPGIGCECHWVWDEVRGVYYCPICGCTITEEEYLNGAHCQCSTEEGGAGYCWCPLECDWTVMVFMALLAAGYVAMKRWFADRQCA